MDSGVSGSLDRIRRSTKFRLRHSGESLAVRGAATSLVPRVSLSSSSSASAFVTLGCRQLSSSCHFARHQSECLGLRLPPTSSVSVLVCLRFARLRPRLSPFRPSSSISIFVSLRRSARWLVQRASAVGSMFYIESLETTVTCVF